MPYFGDPIPLARRIFLNSKSPCCGTSAITVIPLLRPIPLRESHEFIVSDEGSTPDANRPDRFFANQGIQFSQTYRKQVRRIPPGMEDAL